MAKNKEPKTRRFRVALVDDETHKHLWTLKFTRPGFLLMVLSVAAVLIAGAFALVSLTPLRTFIPGYPDAHTQRAAIRNAATIDSLEGVVSRWEFYAGNLRRVFEGEDPVRIDSIIRSYAADTLDRSQEARLHKQDTLLRQVVKDAEQFGLTAATDRRLPIEGIHFFTPVKGVVAEGFDAATHPRLEIKATAGAVAMAVLSGTVVSALWSDEDGYTLVIQHPDEIISVYSHVRSLLRHEGDRVKAGTPVAVVGASDGGGEDFLRLELWYKGEAVDPARFISF